MFASIESNLRHCGPLLTYSVLVRSCMYVRTNIAYIHAYKQDQSLKQWAA